MKPWLVTVDFGTVLQTWLVEAITGDDAIGKVRDWQEEPYDKIGTVFSARQFSLGKPIAIATVQK